MNKKVIFIGLVSLVLTLNGCRGSSQVAKNPATRNFFAEVGSVVVGSWLWKKVEEWTCPENVICENGEKKLAPGYKFKDPLKPQKGAVWSPGIAHSERTHIIASNIEGKWEPEAGYEFYDKENLYVKWSPGIGHIRKSNVVASEKEGKFEPARDYVWSSEEGSFFRENHQDLNVIKMGEVEIIGVDDNVYDTFNQKGMRVHVRIKTNGLKDINCRIVAFFSHESGEDLKDRNGRYRTEDGQVSFSQDFQPSYYNSEYKDFVMFMPYEEFDIIFSGKYNLKYYVALYNPITERYFAKSEYSSVIYTKGILVE